MRPGDWECSGCHHINFRKNHACRRCGAINQTAQQSKDTGSRPAHSSVDVFTTDQWYAYCDKFGRGVIDPTKHEPGFIKEFLRTYNDAQRPAPQAEAQNIAELFRECQPKSRSWRSCWEAYCYRFGEKKCDPGEHDQEYLIGFMEFLGNQGAESMKMVFGEYIPDDQNKSGPASDKDDLVRKVKLYQRGSDRRKEEWWIYCDRNYNGVRDPSKHSIDVLKQFLRSVGQMH